MDTTALMEGIFTDLMATKKKTQKIKQKRPYETNVSDLSSSNIELMTQNPYER